MESKSLHILLVEDDAVDIKNIHRAFLDNHLPHIMHIARNGSEALKLLRQTGPSALSPAPNVILLDIRMPHMDGLAFLKELRQDPVLKPLAVYILTGSNEEQDKIEAYRFNVAGYIVKPDSYQEFVEAIKSLKEYWELIEIPDQLNLNFVN